MPTVEEATDFLEKTIKDRHYLFLYQVQEEGKLQNMLIEAKNLLSSFIRYKTDKYCDVRNLLRKKIHHISLASFIVIIN